MNTVHNPHTDIFPIVSDFVIHEQALLTSDVTWYASGPIFWHVAENAVGVLCACMPSFAPLFKGKLGRVKSRSPGASDLTGNPYYHRMGPPLPPYSEYIEDETLLHRGGCRVNTVPGFEEYALHAVHLAPQGKSTSSESQDDDVHHTILKVL